MRSAFAVLLTTTPALAHTGAGPHLHEALGFWVTAAAFALGLGLTLGVALSPARARA